MSANDFEPGGFWIRAGARAIDWVVHAFIGFFVALFLGVVAAVLEMVRGASISRFIETAGETSWVTWVGGALSAIAYHSMFEGISGTTIGKRLLRLQVIGEPAVPIRFMQGVKRSVAFLVDALFFGAIAWGVMSETPERRRIGDNWAETRVVYRRSLPAELRPSTLRFIGALAAAFAITALFDLATQIFNYLWLIRAE